MNIDAAICKPSHTVILSEAKNLGSLDRTHRCKPEMFHFVQHDNAIDTMSSNHAS